MIRPLSRAAALAGMAFLLLGLSACSTNPATGEQSFTAFMSPEDELRVGREQHPKILEEFGGAYDDPRLAAYVTRIGNKLGAISHRPDLNYTFTILDSPIVNAFALPGGYVYVSRGLLALADNEAELAGVIGHEIGHVTARHSAERYSRSVLVGLGAGVISAVIGDAGATDLLNLGAGLYVRGYSRSQELDADQLGLRYMMAGDYDPNAIASFLERLRARATLDAALNGTGGNPDGYDLLATHPRTIDRVRQAQAAVGGLRHAGRLERETYLNQLDGMLYGDNPEQGFVRGRRFVHPVLRFEFVVPPDYALINGQTHVTAIGPDKARILFDTTSVPAGMSMRRYLGTSEWTRQLVPLTNLEVISVNGMDGATAIARLSGSTGSRDVRVVAVRADTTKIYRFIFVGPTHIMHRQQEELRRTTYSLRRLDAAETVSLKPYRLRIHRVEPGDTVGRLAQWMPEGPDSEARFRVLNGLTLGQEPAVGQLVKYVSF
ncbi:MAG: M48 family metalloprotease [Alphaproteobacteria bacterium]|nr:M48 family metalloprotease [Alphaproteobacteria bacterium]